MKTGPSAILVGILVAALVGFPSAYSDPKLPDDMPDVSKAQFKVRVIEAGNLKAFVQPLYTTFGNPANYVTPAGGLYDGVGDLILTRTDGTFRCSGSLMTTGVHVLTAAHCVTNDVGAFNLTSGTVKFEGDAGSATVAINAAATAVHPDWDGDVLRGNDVAILKLVSAPPSEITRYDIDRNGNDDVGAIGLKAGYGKSGNGNDGSVLASGTKRDGQNKYDDTADTMLKALRLVPDVNFVSGSVLQYDFDNGISQNDAFGFFFGKTNLGLGQPEVISAPGDSGGPTLTNGVISGITSYGVRLQTITKTSSDVDGQLNSTFGEFAGDTRVSKYSSFIDSVTGGGSPGDTTAPSVSISRSPVAPTSSDTVTFTATASDNIGVTSVKIYVDDLVGPKMTCSASPCSFVGGPYAAGSTHSYYSTASDAAGNTSRDPSTATYSFNVASSAGGGVAVTSIVPNQVSKGATVSVIISGSGFQTGATVSLANGCGSTPVVSGTSVSSATEITANITAKSKGPGRNCTFDVIVTNPDGSSGVLTKGFTVRR